MGVQGPEALGEVLSSASSGSRVAEAQAQAPGRVASLRHLLRRLLRAPAVHFTVAGMLAFVALGGPVVRTAAATAKRTIVVDADRIRGLRRDYQLANHVRPNEADTRALVESLVEEEILFREAVARGFEQGDRSIRWRVIRKMKYLGEDHGEGDDALYRRGMELGLYKSDPVVRRILVEKIRLLVGRAAPEPSDDELRAWYQVHRDDYRQADRVSFHTVFFSRQRHGEEGARAAAEAAAALARRHGVEIESSLGGDPFVMGSVLKAQSRRDVAQLFGARFADELLAMPKGTWSGAVESAYGYHVVFVEERFVSRTPDFDEVRSQVLKSYEAAAQERRVREFLTGTRRDYVVRIDDDEIRRSGRA